MNKRRHSSCFIILTLTNLLLGSALLLHARASRAGAAADLAVKADLARSLKLTDLCLFTEARYTRHPAMADRHAPFQEHPTALDHFPSGSLLTPPLQTARQHAKGH